MKEAVRNGLALAALVGSVFVMTYGLSVYESTHQPVPVVTTTVPGPGVTVTETVQAEADQAAEECWDARTGSYCDTSGGWAPDIIGWDEIPLPEEAGPGDGDQLPRGGVLG